MKEHERETSILTRFREEVTKVVDFSLLESQKCLDEVFENMKETIRDDQMLWEQAEIKIEV